jgi:hydroxyacylglutathione hydrolase
MYTVQDVCRYLDRGHAIRILDVRSEGEVESEGRIPNAVHIHVTQVPERADEIPRDGTLHIFCGSGLRSMVAASYLAASGRDDVAVILGGLAGWSSTSCPLEL